MPARSQAADDRYRIEILIFRHLESIQTPDVVDSLRDYSFAQDLLPGPAFLNTPADPDTELLDPSEDADAVLPSEGLSEGLVVDSSNTQESLLTGDRLLDPVTAGEELAEEGPEEDPLALVVPYDPWADLLLIEDMGEEMQESWRRLRLSGPFRPLQFMAWEQNAEAPYPTMRAHNTELVFYRDPWSVERAILKIQLAREAKLAAAMEDENPDSGETTDNKDGAPRSETPVVYGDTTNTEDVGTSETLMDDAFGDGTESNPNEARPIPEPTLYFSLDGTSRLIRSRFLHLELDLEIRLPRFEHEEAIADPGVLKADTMADAMADATADSESTPLSGGGLVAAATQPFSIQDPAGDPVITSSGTVMAMPVPASFDVFSIRQDRQVKTVRMEYFDSPTIGVLAWITPIEVEDDDEGQGESESNDVTATGTNP